MTQVKCWIERHVQFETAATDIGYGLRPEHPLEMKAANAGSGAKSASSFEQFAKQVEPYTLDFVSELSGVPRENLLRLGSLSLRGRGRRRQWQSLRQPRSADFGFHVQKGLFEEYRLFNSGPDIPKKGHEMAELETYHQVRGLR